MGTVIRFPDEKRMGWTGATRMQPQPATVVILPVIRVERQSAESAPAFAPEAGTPRGGGRRRPGRRS